MRERESRVRRKEGEWGIMNEETDKRVEKELRVPRESL